MNQQNQKACRHPIKAKKRSQYPYPESPHPQCICQIPVRKHKSADTGYRHHNQRHRGNQVCLYRRGTHHDTADYRNRLPDSLGQVHTGFLEQLGKTEDFLNGGTDWTQEQIDAVYDELLAALNALKTYHVNAMYTDIHAGTWYYDAVDFVTRYGIMNGMDAGAFNAGGNVNRAQFVTILYRIAGEPTVTIDNPFVDVPEGQWYTNAVLWAFEMGITTGADATHFNPGGTLVRQNMVTFLMRFAKTMGVDTSARADLSGYTDAGQILPYAMDAMQWAVAEGIISGMSATTLAPNGLANRAQIATIIQRFILNKLW